jgi:hypothetical protein
MQGFLCCGDIRVPVEALRTKVSALLRAEEVRLWHLHTRLSRHEAVCVFDRADVPSILRGRKLDPK